MSHEILPWHIARVERYLRGVKTCDQLELLVEMLRPAAMIGEAQPPSLLLLDLLEAEIAQRRSQAALDV